MFKIGDLNYMLYLIRLIKKKEIVNFVRYDEYCSDLKNNLPIRYTSLSIYR